MSYPLSVDLDFTTSQIIVITVGSAFLECIPCYIYLLFLILVLGFHHSQLYIFLIQQLLGSLFFHSQQFYKVVPIKDIRNLYVTFPIPDLQKYYKSNPGHYLGHLIGHEGPGSLLSELKSKGRLLLI